MVKRVRASVDLSSGLGPEQMRFDLEAASALYQELLAPVQAAWGKADTLLVVANGALGQIPFSLLPTANVTAGKAEDGLPLSQFRQVPWLARKLAVAYVPSVQRVVGANLAISVIPREVVAPHADPHLLKLVELQEDWVERRFALYFRDEKMLSPASALLVAHLQACARRQG